MCVQYQMIVNIVLDDDKLIHLMRNYNSFHQLLIHRKYQFEKCSRYKILINEHLMKINHIIMVLSLIIQLCVHINSTVLILNMFNPSKRIYVCDLMDDNTNKTPTNVPTTTSSIATTARTVSTNEPITIETIQCNSNINGLYGLPT
eukprot:416311_1